MVVCNYTVYKLWRVGRDLLEFHPDSSKMVTPTHPRLRAIMTAAMADVQLEFGSIEPSMTMHSDVHQDYIQKVSRVHNF